MHPPASFSSLPPELVAEICGDSGLEKKDLVALRLTSKSQGIHASATKTFARRYFTDVLLLWSKYSLETFVDISQHPVFGPTIRKIQLSCARYSEGEFGESVQELLDEGHARRELVVMIQELAKRCDHDHEQFDPERVGVLLDQAFDHLARSNNSFVLAVSADEEKSLGRNKILGPRMESHGWWADPYSALSYLLSAANRSSLQIRKIEIDVEADLECDLDSHSWVFEEWKDLKSVRSISELTIDLRVSLDHNVLEGFGMVQSLLSLAVHLKALHIRSNIFTPNDTKFRTLAELISRLPLEELHLTRLEMKPDIMIGMLENLGPTLCRLKILNCNITGSWKRILLSIQQHALQLDRLHIGRNHYAFKRPMVYQGVTEVRLGVAECIHALG
jgi:hypothetical protein